MRTFSCGTLLSVVAVMMLSLTSCNSATSNDIMSSGEG